MYFYIFIFLFILYIYTIYNGIFFKFFNSILPFETIYCETGASSVEKDLSNLESKDGQKITSNNNTYNNNDSVHTKTGDNIKSSLTTTTSNNLLPTKINPVIPVTPVTPVTL